MGKARHRVDLGVLVSNEVEPGTAGTEKVTRVLHLLPIDLARGAQTYARVLSEGLGTEHGQQVTATIFQSKFSVLDPDVALGAPVSIGRRVGFSIAAFSRLRRHLHENHYDVIVAHGGESLKYASLTRPSSSRLIYYKIGTSSDILRSRWRRSLHGWAVRRADMVAGVSGEVLEEARRLFGVPADRTECIPNGRDPGPFYRKAARRDSVVRFIFVGHLTETKRPWVFIDTVERLRARGLDVEGLMIGDGPLLHDLRARQSDAVELLGRRSDIPRLLSTSDAMIFTSERKGEGMPGVLIEAGLAGLPVISTDVPGASTVIADGATGIIVDVQDPMALEEAAAFLASNRAARERMGRAARNRCLEEFTLDRSLARWRDLLARQLPAHDHRAT